MSYRGFSIIKRSSGLVAVAADLPGDISHDEDYSPHFYTQKAAEKSIDEWYADQQSESVSEAVSALQGFTLKAEAEAESVHGWMTKAAYLWAVARFKNVIALLEDKETKE